MNDFDLDTKLKRVPLPERPAAYWDNFPALMRRQLGRTVSGPEIQERRLPSSGWKMTVEFACLVVGLLVLGQPLKSATCAIFKNEKILRQQLAELPVHLRVFMADEHGLHYLIAEKP